MKVKKGLTIVEYDGEEVRVRQTWILLSDDGEVIGSREEREVIPRGKMSDDEIERRVEEVKKKLSKI